MNDMGVERWAGIAAGLTVGVAVLYFLYGPRFAPGPSEPEEPPPAVERPAAEPNPPVTEPTAEAAPTYPVPAADATAAAPEPAKAPAPARAPTPDLAASDAEVRAAAAATIGAGPVEALLVPQRVIQNIVATVDSLDRDPIPLRFRALSEVPEVPVVDKQGDQLLLSSDNDERYRLLADALRATTAASIASLYLRYYPLLQSAYREMGYPGAHFNDRVVQIIDHLLAAPTVEHPIELVRPKVAYLFADPALEELSSGQKIMVRIGPANATIARQRLVELRALLTAGKAHAAAADAAAMEAAPPATEPEAD